MLADAPDEALLSLAKPVLGTSGLQGGQAVGNVAADGFLTGPFVLDEQAAGYGSLDTYRQYLDQSRFFVAEQAGRCVGVVRVITSGPLLPPFFDLPFADAGERARCAQAAAAGRLEELATVAVLPGTVPFTAVLNLWRLAYRDAKARGVLEWGIIMEPRRVWVLNRHYGTSFVRLGRATEYQGGQCAAHLMNFASAEEHIRRHHPYPARADFFLT